MIMFWRPTDVDERGGPRRGLLRGRLSRPAVGRDREDESAATLVKLTGADRTPFSFFAAERRARTVVTGTRPQTGDDTVR